MSGIVIQLDDPCSTKVKNTLWYSDRYTIFCSCNQYDLILSNILHKKWLARSIPLHAIPLQNIAARNINILGATVLNLRVDPAPDFFFRWKQLIIFFCPANLAFCPPKCTFFPDPLLFGPALYVRKCLDISEDLWHLGLSDRSFWDGRSQNFVLQLLSLSCHRKHNGWQTVS